MRHRISIFFCSIVVVMITQSCRQHYELTAVERSRILIDNRFDKPLEGSLAAFISPYQQRVDSVMKPIVGYTANYMYADAPESPLSDLLPDILVWSGKHYNEQPEFGIYNIGGMRAALAEGEVTVGDIYALAPFENRICFLTLSGKAVKQLFEEIAMQKGQGVSREVRLRIGSDGSLKEALIKGQPIDEKRDYRVVTIDYVAQGNDRMSAFKQKTDVNQPEGENDNIRFVIMDFFREKMNRGEKVKQEIEGRITIE